MWERKKEKKHNIIINEYVCKILSFFGMITSGKYSILLVNKGGLYCEGENQYFPIKIYLKQISWVSFIQFTLFSLLKDQISLKYIFLDGNAFQLKTGQVFVNPSLKKVDKYIINIDNYLSKGATGKVYECIDSKSQVKYACKVV